MKITKMERKVWRLQMKKYEARRLWLFIHFISENVNVIRVMFFYMLVLFFAFTFSHSLSLIRSFFLHRILFLVFVWMLALVSTKFPEWNLLTLALYIFFRIEVFAVGRWFFVFSLYVCVQLRFIYSQVAFA